MKKPQCVAWDISLFAGFVFVAFSIHDDKDR